MRRRILCPSRATVLIASAVALSAGPVLAADVGAVEPLPTPDVVTALPSNDWSGFYLGALLGYNWGEANSDSTLNEVDVGGIEGGGYLGAN